MTQLYRAYDADGLLLYVGISVNATQRLRQHKSTSPWAHRIAHVEVADYPNRASALRAETFVIGTELPLFNQRKQGDVPMTNAQVGAAVGHTLAEAYRLARERGHTFCTIDPIEFASMSRDERRHHRRILKRLVREHERKSPRAHH